MKKINLKEKLWIIKWWISDNFSIIAAVVVATMLIAFGYLLYENTCLIRG